ncbi:MAG: histone deacetylase family protein, partial [Rhodanobacter sp.]|nr:histone deacetylase family protein [Rhodanobacter sp.]
MLRLYSHSACLQHDPGPGHVERPARLRAVLQALDHDRYATLDRVEAPRATREQLLRVHSIAHVDRILAGASQEGTRQLDPDTVMSSGSFEAALRAAGAVVAAVDAALTHDRLRAFCAVRPPGHHATGDQAMGFCLFNNIAVGAAHAMAEHGLKRIAIADFDVHHGNGTQAIFEHDRRVLFVSSHQSPLYPDSGREDEHGVGNIVNGTLSPGAGSHEFRELWDSRLLPRMHAFNPQLVLVSAGFDA